MSRLVVTPTATPLEGTTRVPGDKAIGHRALLLAAAAHGRSTVRGLAPGQDVASTRRCLESLGTDIVTNHPHITITGRGVEGWSEPGAELDCANSGTTMRILSGLVARCAFRCVLDGDESLRRRPMGRVVEPLRALGAKISAKDGRPPIEIVGGALRGTEVRLEVASGQVKSAVLLAGLGATGTTAVVEPAPSRDDTERMLAALGAPVRSERRGDGSVRVEVGPHELAGFDLDVPGDLSSAAFLVAAALLAGSVRIEDVALNPSRAGFLDVVARMGGDLSRSTEDERLGQPAGVIEAARSRLSGIGLEGPVIPSLLDELPLVAVLATQAAGETVVAGAAELRVKESDRIAALADGLGRMGARFEERPDGFVVRGPGTLRGAEVDSWGDHRVAMALAVAALVADGETTITGWDASAVSWPGFERTLASLGAGCRLEEDARDD